MKLSILICSLVSRTELYRALAKGLRGQIDSLEAGDIVEVLVLTDNKEITTGSKRNKLLQKATGDYIVYIDDDDKVSANYISALLGKMQSNPDVIVFDAHRYHNGKFDRPVKYGIDYEKDFNTARFYYRIPNHLMCVKRELALQVPFKDVNFGEDSDYAKRLLPLLKKQERINEVLYEYWYDDKVTETANRK